jgi:hypothetical protein
MMVMAQSIFFRSHGIYERLFELAIQLRTFFYSAICNTGTVGTSSGLFDRYMYDLTLIATKC